MQVVQLKIDLTKIDKNKLFKSEKTGSIYLDAAVLLQDADDQYGNRGMIVQNVTKEDREKGEKGNILGNCKIFIPEAAQSAEITEDDLPF